MGRRLRLRRLLCSYPGVNKQIEMMKKMDEARHSKKMMWGCLVLAVLAIVLVVSGVGAGAIFIIPCMLMMGAMMWMMMGGMGSDDETDSDKT